MSVIYRLGESSFEKEQRRIEELIDTLKYYKLLLKEAYLGDWGGLTTENHLGMLWDKESYKDKMKRLVKQAKDKNNGRK